MAYNKFYQSKAEMNREKEAMDACSRVETVEAFLKRGGKIEGVPSPKFSSPSRRANVTASRGQIDAY